MDVSGDLEYCGHVYALLVLDEGGHVAEPMETSHVATHSTVILCNDGKDHLSYYTVILVMIIISLHATFLL